MSSSLQVFRRFFVQLPNGELDAQGVISEECYLAWLESRTSRISASPEKAFHRAISAHLTGVDGRSPFTPQEEEALLRVVRRKKRWPCFRDSKVKRGEMGFRAQGMHERAFQEQHATDPPGSAAAAQATATATATAAAAASKKRSRVEAVEDIHQLGQTLLHRHLPLGANGATPQALLDRIQPNFPNQFLLMFDFAARNMASSLVLQSHLATELFGATIRPQLLFNAEQVPQVLADVQAAFGRLGAGSFATSLSLLTLEAKYKPFNVFLIIDPDTRLWVVIGHESDATTTAAAAAASSNSSDEDSDF